MSGTSEQKLTNNTLTKKQLEVAELLANPSVEKNKTEICDEAGVSRTSFYEWLKKKEFTDYVASLVDKYTDSELSGVWKALIRKCESGDVSAIKLFFEMKGKYKQSVDLTGTVTFVDDVSE